MPSKTTTPRIRGTAKKEEPQKKEERYYGSEAALLRLTNLLYDTDDEHLPSLTRINSTREAILLSIQVTKEMALDPKRIKLKVPLSRIFRNSFLMFKRSIGMKAFLVGAGLAQGQAEAEEEAREEEEF